MTELALIAAVARDRVIGLNNTLPWHLPEDLQHFKRTTLGAPIVLGRKTWDSIGRPLPGRHNIVVTRQANWQAAGASRAVSVAAALAWAGEVPRVFVIGGAELYAQALPLADALYLTEIDAAFAGDAYFPAFDPSLWTLTQRDSHTHPEGWAYHFCRYARVRSPELTS